MLRSCKLCDVAHDFRADLRDLNSEHSWPTADVLFYSSGAFSAEEYDIPQLKIQQNKNLQSGSWSVSEVFNNCQTQLFIVKTTL
jgi:hypothetical protein